MNNILSMGLNNHPVGRVVICSKEEEEEKKRKKK